MIVSTVRRGASQLLSRPALLGAASTSFPLLSGTAGAPSVEQRGLASSAFGLVVDGESGHHRKQHHLHQFQKRSFHASPFAAAAAPRYGDGYYGGGGGGVPAFSARQGTFVNYGFR